MLWKLTTGHVQPGQVDLDVFQRYFHMIKGTRREGLHVTRLSGPIIINRVINNLIRMRSFFWNFCSFILQQNKCSCNYEDISLILFGTMRLVTSHE